MASPADLAITLGVQSPSTPGPEFAKLHLSILRQSALSFGAKCLYARLVTFAGRNGVCNPSDATLAGELGISDRRVRELRVELRDWNLVSWRRTQKANSYRLNPPEQCRLPDRKESSGQTGVIHPIRAEEKFPSDRKNPSDKKMSLKIGLPKDVPSKEEEDHDLSPQNRKQRDSAATQLLRRYPNLRNVLRQHLQETDPTLPSEDKVVRIIQSTNHAPEAEIIRALGDLKERGYGAEHIRTYAYFETALPDYFQRKREREEAAHPCGHHEWEERNLAREELAPLAGSSAAAGREGTVEGR
jgi:hypothetical protein